MNKQDVYALLDENGFWHEITEHKAVYNMAELAEVECPYPEADAKNLFVRDDKKRNYYLITVKGDKRVDLKAFLDREVLNAPGLIGVHPNDNTATVWMKTEDLIALVKEHGTEVELAEI